MSEVADFGKYKERRDKGELSQALEAQTIHIMPDEAVFPEDVASFYTTENKGRYSVAWMDEPQATKYISNLSYEDSLRLSLLFERAGYKRSEKFQRKD